MSAILTDDNINNITSIVEVLETEWFNKYGYPKTILFKQGKVQVSKIEEKINKIAPLKTTVTCKSRMTTFNKEMEQQWEQNQHQLSGDDFVNTVNFAHNFRKPELEGKRSKVNSRNYDDDNENSNQDKEEETEHDFEEIYHLTNNHLTSQLRRKTISLCRHKLQGRTGCNHKGWRKRSKPHARRGSPGPGEDRQTELDLLESSTDLEWAQLPKMKELLRRQRKELLQQGTPEQDSYKQHPGGDTFFMENQEGDDLEEADLAFITSILESFSESESRSTMHTPRTKQCLDDPFYAEFPPEGALT